MKKLWKTEDITVRRGVFMENENGSMIDITEYRSPDEVKISITGPFEYIPYDNQVSWMHIGNYVWKWTITN